MGAVGLLKHIVKKQGGEIDLADKPYIRPFNGITLVRFKIESDGQVYAYDNNGAWFSFPFSWTLDIIEHIDKVLDLKLSYLYPQRYEEFDINDFIRDVNELEERLDKYIFASVYDGKKLENDEWLKPSHALSVIMNDVQHYNRWIEKESENHELICGLWHRVCNNK